MRPTPYVASLRIYEPIESFNFKDQNLWSKQFSNTQTIFEEQNESLCKSITLNYFYSKIDGAHFLSIDNKKFVSPWSIALRNYHALDNLSYSLPASIIGHFIPKFVQDTMKKSFNSIEDKVPHILTSNWSIPPRWFALFLPEDRLRGNNEHGAFTILRTIIANAKHRATFTHQSVLSAFGSGPIESEINNLIKWLEIFDHRSIVELDYGGLANYLNNLLVLNGEAGLAADTSVEDVASSIAGLASGDGALASRGYERLVSRWRKVAAMEVAT
jgi:hypothetical protein